MSPWPRRIFFERDGAGFSNARLQLESLLVIAEFTGRQLVLPSASRLMHLERPFHEGHFWSLPDLSRFVSVTLASDGQQPPSTDRLKVPLHEVRFDEGGRPSADSGLGEGDWFFGANESRLQHFECLRLATEAQRRRAAEVVRNSFQVDRRYHAGARRALRRLGLKQGEYAAAHVRRGDFKDFRPQQHVSGGSLASSALDLCSREGLPVLVATDAEANDPVLRDFAAHCNVAVKCTSQGYDEEDDDLARVAVDLLLCTWAKRFIGTPDSTFSLTIMGMRAKAKKEGVDLDAEPRMLLNASAASQQSSGTCWNKPTTFEALASPSPSLGWLV